MYPWTRRGRKTADPSDGSIENFAGKRSLYPLGDERMNNNNIQSFFLKTLILAYIYMSERNTRNEENEDSFEISSFISGTRREGRWLRLSGTTIE